MVILWLLTILGLTYSQQFVLNDPKFSYELCDSEYVAFKIHNVKLIPDSPIKGENLTVIVNGTLEKDVIVGAKLTTLFKFMNIALFRQTFDVCKELENTPDAPMKCPIEKGDKLWKYTFNIPDNMPSGKYQINANITNLSDEVLLCSKVYFKL